MSARPRLARSIPFWGLITASLASAAAGALILVDKLGTMTTTLLDGTATGVEVYVGQSLAVLGAILIGAGVLGLLLAFTVGAIATLRPAAAVEVVEPLDDEIDEPVDAAPAGHGYERGLGYTSAIDTVDDEKEPAAAR
ncbi:dinucleotide-utilizing enzyme [Microbacterium hominis]|uniref:Dinucleotide-utilizing enzyme n=1 Tax=Microbacterium hominis TaxID=162426 RepID=A0A7D4QCU9_9MICO|nr:dinucleotide-utilizing enzyme [Microbacterium hominis]QKJ19597.1 dinucleotide-utilizing enzyme [Microbacterium hominis]